VQDRILDQPGFGERLKALRLERDLSQAALAGDEISTPYLSRLESGARRPTPRIVSYLAERLQVSPRAFETMQDSPLAQALAAASSAADAVLSSELASALRTKDRTAPAALRWQALWMMARAHATQGQHHDEYQVLTELAALSDEMDVPELRVRTNTMLAQCARVLGKITEACEHAAAAVAEAGPLSVADRTAALDALISAQAEAGHLVQARARADELVSLTEPGGGTALTRALWTSATVAIRQGEPARAHADLERALASLNSHDDLELWMRLRLAAASLLLQVTPPQTEAASVRLAESEPAVNLVGTAQNRQELALLRAQLAFKEGRYAEASERCAALDGIEIQLSFRDRIRLQALQSMLRILDGQTEAGVAQLQQLAQQAYDAHNVELAAELWRELATILAKARDPG
jgi:transcriptional regulator with XRE-family HTH domain